MGDGTTKPIEEIRLGDLVQAYDEASARIVLSAVTGLHQPIWVETHYLINGRIRVTGTQPVLVGGIWIEISDLELGATLAAPSGAGIPVLSIRKVDEPVQVFNFEVKSIGTYVIHGMIVHNKPETYTICPQ